MSEENGNATEATPAPSGPAAGIARGRMHAALVYAIKFQSGEAKDGEIAKKFATTPGKVNDIRKDRNFKYVTENLAFTAGEVAEAVERFTSSVNAENSTVAEDERADVIAAATAAINGVPTTDGESQLAGVRKAERKPRGKPEAEEEVTEGSGDEEDLDAMLA